MNSINGPARSEAFRMRKEGVPLACPFIVESTFVDPHTPQATDLVNQNKPEFYARFSGVIDMLIKEASQHIPNTPLGLQMGDYVLRPEQIPTLSMLQNHWQLTLSRHLLEQIEPRMTTDEHLILLGRCATARHRLTGKTYADPLESMLGGIDTATKSICGHIGGMAEFCQQHCDSTDPVQRARKIGKSTGPILNSVNTSTTRLSAFTDLHMTRGIYNPLLYDEHPATGTIDLKLPFNEHMGKIHNQFVKLADINENEPIIGCPIILTPQQLQNMWRWGVSMAVKCDFI